jgi:hypothetical protein
MISCTHRVAASPPILFIALSGCSGNTPTTRPSAAASPKKIDAPIPPGEPLGPPQDLSRKLMERGLTGVRQASAGDDGDWSFTATAFVLQK